MKAMTVEPGKRGTARFEDLPEPDAREGSVLVEGKEGTLITSATFGSTRAVQPSSSRAISFISDLRPLSLVCGDLRKRPS